MITIRIQDPFSEKIKSSTGGRTVRFGTSAVYLCDRALLVRIGHRGGVGTHPPCSPCRALPSDSTDRGRFQVKKLQRAALRDAVKVEVSSKYQTVDKLQQYYLFIPAKYKVGGSGPGGRARPLRAGFARFPLFHVMWI